LCYCYVRDWCLAESNLTYAFFGEIRPRAKALRRRIPLGYLGNAAYWFRRVGAHPVFAPLAEEARALGLRSPSGGWDPFAFIDLCEQHRDRGTPEEVTLRRVQRREWELLFDFCYRAAAAR
jgi:hypothetical protein